MTSTKYFISFVLFIVLNPITSIGQEFKKWNDDILKKKTVRYYNQNAQFIVQKTQSLDSSELKFEIGLIIFRSSIKTDDFMFEGSQIILDDNSVIHLSENIQSQYIMSGKNMLFIKHLLTSDEMVRLKANKISKFRIYQYEYSFDKWQKDDIFKAIRQIESE
jgi:hypothetical protein